MAISRFLRPILLALSMLTAEQAVAADKVLKAVVGHRLPMELVYAPVGQAGVDAAGDPLPLLTREIADKAEAILFGSAGVPGDEKIEYNMRPGASLLRLRKQLNKRQEANERQRDRRKASE